MSCGIVDDTLKKPNGKWDKQSLTMFVFGFLGAICGVYVVVSDYFLTKEINPSAIIVVGMFLSMAGYQANIVLRNKKIDKELDIDQEPNPQYTDCEDDKSTGTY